MVHCSILGCYGRSERQEKITFHTFPKNSALHRIWVRATGRQNWQPSKFSRVCSRHFEPNCFRKTPNKTYLVPCVPTLHITQSNEQDALPGPSETPITPPWHNPASPGVSDHSQQQDPLRGLIDQCRFCGEFSKDCVVVSSHTPYLAGEKTTLAFNHISVQLDFNEDLPNAVCKDCDSKLKQFSEFVKLVKDAQDSIKKIKEDENVRETEVFIKTEVPEDDGNSISIGDTVFVKKTFTHKRKSDDINEKKIKVTKPDVMVECDDVLIDIKQENDDHDIDSSRLSDEGSETLSIPEEMKRAYALDIETADTFSVSEVIKIEINKK